MNLVWAERSIGGRSTMQLSDKDTGLVVAEVVQDLDSVGADVVLYAPLSRFETPEDEIIPQLGERYTSQGHAMKALEAYTAWWKGRR